VRHDGWLIELVTQALRPEVGAVGALLEHEDGRVQHAGVLVGVNGTAEHAFREWPSDAAGYLALLRSVRRVSAVTGACLALRREVYLQVGGLDESVFPVELNDVDLCLRIEQAGLSVLWTPFARLTHIEGGTRGRGDRIPSANDGGTLGRQEAQRSAFVERWRERLTRDPYYSPRLSTSGATYMLKP
jgi:O-antigen biosynthesis protein